MSDFFSVKYSENYGNYQVIGKDNIAVISFSDEGDAIRSAFDLNNCEHEQLERPDWFGGDALSTDYPEVELCCTFCGAVASFPVPTNLEWGHE